MSRTRVVVRCDVGPAHGVGHLMRCLALAEELVERGYDVVFSADAASVPFAQRQLEVRDLRVLPPPDTPEEHVAQLETMGASALVLDSYLLPPEVYAATRAVVPTLAIVDGDPAGRQADLYLDQNIGAEDDHWALPEGAVRLAGLEYALMRSDVLRARGATRPAEQEAPLRVFAFFGGTDVLGAAPVVTRALAATGRPFHLRVVAAGERQAAELAAVRTTSGQRVEVIEPTSRLADEVVAAGLVLSASGTSMWELLCLGAPCALVCLVDNQVAAYERITALGVVAGMGTLTALREDQQVVVPLLGGLLDDTGERARLAAAGRALVDGRGRERVADALARRLAQE